MDTGVRADRGDWSPEIPPTTPKRFCPSRERRVTSECSFGSYFRITDPVYSTSCFVIKSLRSTHLSPPFSPPSVFSQSFSLPEEFPVCDYS